MSTKYPGISNAKLVEFRYQLWTRLCEAADELMSIADAWYETDPDLIELHSQRAGYSTAPDPEDDIEQ
jgi:hypothetical protein